MPHLDISNWIDIITLVVNVVLGLWIAIALQNSVANKRVLKDHFISEVKDLRNDYQHFFDNIEVMNSTDFLPWFKTMNIKIENLSHLLHEKYKIKKDRFEPFQIHLNTLVTSNSDFASQFRSGGPIRFSSASKQSFITFQQSNNYLFNDLIVTINDY